MLTTVELPPALLRKAKVRAAARGESLKTLLTRAMAAELGQGNETTTRRRVELPLFGNSTGPPVDLSGLDLAKALAADEAPRRELIWVSFSKRDDRSHLLWTDDYLAAFAHAANTELVTLDKGSHTRYPAVRVRCLS